METLKPELIRFDWSHRKYCPRCDDIKVVYWEAPHRCLNCDWTSDMSTYYITRDPYTSSPTTVVDGIQHRSGVYREVGRLYDGETTFAIEENPVGGRQPVVSESQAEVVTS